MLNWSDENQPAQMIRDDELARTLLALARANGGRSDGYIAALIDVATAYGVEAELCARLVRAGCPVKVIEGGGQCNT